MPAAVGPEEHRSSASAGAVVATSAALSVSAVSAEEMVVLAILVMVVSVSGMGRIRLPAAAMTGRMAKRRAAGCAGGAEGCA